MIYWIVRGIQIFLVVSSAVCVKDSAASSYSRRDGSLPMAPPIIEDLLMYFLERNIPLKVEDISQRIKTASEAQNEVTRLYKQHSVIIVRPDMYILWSLRASVREISTFDLKMVAETACCEINRDALITECQNTTDFFTQRFISSIQGYRSLHTQAIYFENTDKGAILKSISRKAKDNVTELTSKITNTKAEGKVQEEGFTAMEMDQPSSKVECTTAETGFSAVSLEDNLDCKV